MGNAPGAVATARNALPWLRSWVPDFLTEYQREGVFTALQWPEQSGLFVWAAGAGKTLGAIIWALSGPTVTTLATAPASCPLLAVTKPSLRTQWAREVERYTTVPALILEGEDPEVPELPSGPVFLVTGYATLPQWMKPLLALRPQSLILDESQIVQSHSRWDVDNREGQRPHFRLRHNIAGAAFRLSRAIPRRLATTATPAGDRVRNLWGQLDLIRPGQWGKFRDFATRYCGGHENSWGGFDTRGASNLGELKERLASMIHRVPYSIAARQLPPKRRQVVYVKVKDQMRAEGIAAEWKRTRKAAGDGTDRAAVASLFELRLAEAASRKRRVAVDYVEDAWKSGQKVVVFTGRRRDVESLEREVRKRIGDGGASGGDAGPPPIWAGHGGYTVKERDAMVTSYMQAPGPAVLIVTGDAFGEGLNLQDSDLAIQVQLPWNTKGIIQREGRVQRLGGRPVLILYLIAEGTIDEHIASILIAKVPSVVQATGQDEVAELGRELRGASEEELLARMVEKVLGGGE